ncbi:Flp pilus minor pilin TadE [Syntrophotalea carbinolica DSM 2380]|uniref:Flp pilus minor pilin TadE n=1 Tax=Syntrophotalea carbinolica (strain DSM 2380 / NBRC 103641 / GraBd1) TaxID=338963 RepID=Q3A3R5_SYNC1|nr:TadE/TadG family type IV pilus assembly protein [Syntrophotalea carbinolica]ABA88992.1 Flp pilus minor pilin TadE [Syntrophotalea carbinolica DSM 2380]
MKFNSQKGAAIVEFAVILPLLLLIVFGIVEFGFIFYNQAILTNASREGARRAIVFETNSNGDRIYNGATVEDTIKRYLYTDYPTNSDLRLVTFGTENLSIAPSSADGEVVINQGDYILVEVQYDYDFMVLPSFAGIPQTITLTGKTTMRAE